MDSYDKIYFGLLLFIFKYINIILLYIYSKNFFDSFIIIIKSNKE